MILTLNHVAQVVPNLKEAIQFYEGSLGALISLPEDQPDHGVRTAFIEFSGTKLELLEPLDEDSPVSNFLMKNAKGGLHHLCFGVKDLESAVTKLKGEGCRVLGHPKIGAHGYPVVFLHPGDCHGVLIELEELP